MLQDILQETILGNTVETYCWSLGIIVSGLLFKRFISSLLSRILFRFIKKYSTGVTYEQFLFLLRKPFNMFVLLISFYVAFDQLEFPAEWKIVPKEIFGLKMILFKSFQIAIVISITWVILRIIDFFALVLAFRASEIKAHERLVPFFKEAIKVIIAIFSFFFILGTIFNVNIASLIAGLGIGGLAIALAAKETLENLFGSFTIFMDKPFVIGDLVKAGNITGHVEKIGFRSTRIRTPEKSYVTVPNKKMVDAEMENLTMRTSRRSEFSIALNNSTSAEQIRSIVVDIKKTLDENPITNTDERSVHFMNFGNCSLEITISYYVNTTNGDVFMQVKEEINYKIMEIMKKHGASFALPLPR